MCYECDGKPIFLKNFSGFSNRPIKAEVFLNTVIKNNN
uniref:Uncharacterized protein n=1 Tax=Siphoviridae sp. ctAUQ2 TaxID=2826182 RepID=A0A8S5N0F6_9CAUD|nr:MAG TPA: hypothetical protein [Siphoviridae sp. ctAUQ2]